MEVVLWLRLLRSGLCFDGRWKKLVGHPHSVWNLLLDLCSTEVLVERLISQARVVAACLVQPSRILDLLALIRELIVAAALDQLAVGPRVKVEELPRTFNYLHRY